MICLVCRPEHLRIEQPINSFQRDALADPPDARRAVAEHQGLLDALGSLGVQIVEVPAIREAPYQVFVRDLVIGGLDRPLLGRLREPIRQPEVEAVVRTLEEAGIVCEASQGGTLEGGDVVVSGEDVFVGVGDRSEVGAVEWLRDRYPQRNVITLEMERGFLHLDMVFNVLSRDSCVYCPEALKPDAVARIRELFRERLELSLAEQRRMSSNFLPIAEHGVVVPWSAVEGVSVAAKAAGRSVTTVDLTEVQKGGGSVRCSTCLLE